MSAEVRQEQAAIAALAKGLRVQRQQAEAVVSLIAQASPRTEGVGTTISRLA